MKKFLISLIFFAFFASKTITAEELTETGIKAYCDLMSTKGDFLGKIKFREVLAEKIKAVEITAQLDNIKLDDGPKGFHLHQFGNTSDECKAAGPHFNPHMMQHGGPLEHVNRHSGDFGNVIVTASKASIRILDSRLRMIDHKTDKEGIIGRAIVLHSKEDDLGKGEGDSKATGNAGSRFACCIIQNE